MNIKSISRSLLQITLLMLVSAVLGIAHAQATRTWVSGVGDDANPCSRTAPCKTFAGAISKTAAGGYISVLDPGGYGAVTITKAITIEAEGDIASSLATGTTGIIINAAATDDVVLRNLSIVKAGSGVAPPSNLHGIRVMSARSVLVDRCRIENGTGFGVDVSPATGRITLAIRDSVISNNSGGGVRITPASAGSVAYSIDGSRFFNNGSGLFIRGRSNGLLSRSVLTAQQLDAVSIDGSAGLASVSLEYNTISDNLGNGVTSIANARAVISNNLIKGNAMGIAFTSPGQVISFGNNTVTFNSTDGSPSSTVLPR